MNVVLFFVVGGMFGLMGPHGAGAIAPPPTADYITTQASAHITTQNGVALKTDSP